MYKLTNLALAMLMMLLLAACGNDDETTPSSDLEDTWTAISVDIDLDMTTEVAGQTVISDVVITGENLAYDLTLDGSDFTTDGSYDMNVMATVGGVPQNSLDNYSNVTGAGTYTTDGDQITINGSFYELQYNGIDLNAANGEQTATYTINSDDQLVISSDDTSTSTASGATTTVSISSTSVWERK